ncbi:MAG: gamma-glutamylcyclotransferase [Patescibacteria group bacterium]|nr:gamma-glutamylcyclotransferase [Patescibacteria group bacterium]
MMLPRFEKWDSPTKDGIHRMFVYGTLRQGESNHSLLKDQELVGYSRANGYVMVSLGAFPGAIKVVNGGWCIYGEIYNVKDEVLPHVDGLEGYPGFYTREEVDVEPYGKCWIYTLPAEEYLKDGSKFIPGGRWKGRDTQCFIWDKTKIAAPYQVDRPLIEYSDKKEEPKVRIIPEVKSIQVGPGYEEIV